MYIFWIKMWKVQEVLWEYLPRLLKCSEWIRVAVRSLDWLKKSNWSRPQVIFGFLSEGSWHMSQWDDEASPWVCNCWVLLCCINYWISCSCVAPLPGDPFTVFTAELATATDNTSNSSSVSVSPMNVFSALQMTCIWTLLNKDFTVKCIWIQKLHFHLNFPRKFN